MSLDVKNRIWHDLAITISMTDLMETSIEKMATLLTTEWALHEMRQAASRTPAKTDTMEMAISTEKLKDAITTAPQPSESSDPRMEEMTI
ncbi:hypothetical protein C2W62_14370 [Candidatus Entotheonella serta]|nr:hypothetical protein C2W62_14370 [Candidatus Entotheonella serta]